uniref:Uncharacterized protein n=1 Tax=Panagrolaimus superbus TaxID=310955 RepID=A0A914Y0V6_9BILA
MVSFKFLFIIFVFFCLTSWGQRCQRNLSNVTKNGFIFATADLNNRDGRVLDVDLDAESDDLLEFELKQNELKFQIWANESNNDIILCFDSNTVESSNQCYSNFGIVESSSCDPKIYDGKRNATTECFSTNIASQKLIPPTPTIIMPSTTSTSNYSTMKAEPMWIIIAVGLIVFVNILACSRLVH